MWSVSPACGGLAVPGCRPPVRGVRRGLRPSRAVSSGETRTGGARGEGAGDEGADGRSAASEGFPWGELEGEGAGEGAETSPESGSRRMTARETLNFMAAPVVNTLLGGQSWVGPRYWRLVRATNALEGKMRALSDAELRGKTDEFRRRVQHGRETLDAVLPEAFAVVREASRRVLGLRHFDVQLIGGMVLHDGMIAEMSTGEGKTLVSTLPAYLNALSGDGVHVVTVNDYLARRDSAWMGRVHKFLGLSVGLIVDGTEPEDRRAAYRMDITYTTNHELGFDYLRDNMADAAAELVHRGFNYIVIDEVDSVMIDEARNPLLIAMAKGEDFDYYQRARDAAVRLVRDLDYVVNEKERNVLLTEVGFRRAGIIFGGEVPFDEAAFDEAAGYVPEEFIIYDAKGNERSTVYWDKMHLKQDPGPLYDELDKYGTNWGYYLIAALKVKELHHEGQQYIVKDGELLIVDEFTGRAAAGRRWSDGIHQAAECKEGLEIRPESVMAAAITLQQFFKQYQKVSGMSGTAMTEHYEFERTYGMRVAVIPPNRVRKRRDLDDLIFKTEKAKWVGVASEAYVAWEEGRPVLVGTTTLEESELVSSYLRGWEVPHSLLNARPQYAAREADTIAQAGRMGAVTIATNMAGRGTDILLGGNPGAMARTFFRVRAASRLVDQATVNSTHALDLPRLVDGRPVPFPVPSSDALRAIDAAIAELERLFGPRTLTPEDLEEVCEFAEEGAKGQRHAQPLLDDASVAGLPLPRQSLAILVHGFVSVERDFKAVCDKARAAVVELGGLHVIGTRRAENRRIDNQLRGRAGRQGDPGSTVFCLSLEDDMCKHFGGDVIGEVLYDKLGYDASLPLDNPLLTMQLDSIQKKVEEYYYDIRQSTEVYDRVLDRMRDKAYAVRLALLTMPRNKVRLRLMSYIRLAVLQVVDEHESRLGIPAAEWDYAGILAALHETCSGWVDVRLELARWGLLPASLLRPLGKGDVPPRARPGRPGGGGSSSPVPPPVALGGQVLAVSARGAETPVLPVELTDDYLAAVADALRGVVCVHERTVGRERAREFLRKVLCEAATAGYAAKVEVHRIREQHVVEVNERQAMLRALDETWRLELEKSNQIRTVTANNSWAQKDPVREYKRVAMKSFMQAMEDAQRDAVHAVYAFDPDAERIKFLEQARKKRADESEKKKPGGATLAPGPAGSGSGEDGNVGTNDGDWSPASFDVVSALRELDAKSFDQDEGEDGEDVIDVLKESP